MLEVYAFQANDMVCLWSNALLCSHFWPVSACSVLLVEAQFLLLAPNENVGAPRHLPESRQPQVILETGLFSKTQQIEQRAHESTTNV